MKVSIIEPVGGHGGMDYYDFSLCTSLVEAGVDATLYTCEKTKVREHVNFETIIAYKNIYSKEPVILRALRYIRGTCFSLFHSRLKNSYCHFHFFHVSLLEFINIILALILRLKIIITVHDVVSFAKKDKTLILYKICFYSCHCIIVHNKFSKTELINRFGIRTNKISVIPHGNYIEYSKFKVKKSTAKKKLKIDPTKKTLLFFGQIKKVKGLEILIQALPAVIETIPDLQLVIAGKVWKDNYSIYSKLIKKYKLQKFCTERIEYIPNNEVSNYFAAADLVVLPYKKIYQSGILLMAMSFGIPVIASDLEGMKEIIEDRKTGFLFQSDNVSSLTKRLIEILSDNENLKKIGDAGRSHVIAHYNWSIIGKQIKEKCYKVI